MKKNTITILGLLSLSSVQLCALTIYTDASGQLYANPAEGRVLLGEFEPKKKKNTLSAQNMQEEKKTKEVKTQANRAKITIINQDSPDFLLGKETHINMKFVPEDAPDMWLKAGVRIQGTLESKSTEYNDVTRVNTDINDAYLRRVRFEIAAGFGKHASFVMDIRNDKSNYGIENTEGSFSVGDAYVKIKKPFDTSLLNFKLYRAKIDVSRTETVKSARVIAYDRPYVADAAAQYISFNRRGANLQAYGDWNKKIHYQIATGASANPDKVKDAQGTSGATIDLSEQSFFYGGKIKLSPFDGWEEKKVTETYMGQGKHFTVGGAYWVVPKMQGTTANGAKLDVKRSLINAEISGHYKGFMAQAEYFKFKDAVEDITATTLNTGTSTGWYATSEYVFSDFYYIAPFFRYESWDKFDDKDGYNTTSTLAGINWYLRGNTTKIGAYYQKDTYEINAGDKDVNIFRVTSQWFF